MGQGDAAIKLSIGEAQILDAAAVGEGEDADKLLHLAFRFDHFRLDPFLGGVTEGSWGGRGAEYK